MPDDDLEIEKNYFLGAGVLGLIAVLVDFLQRHSLSHSRWSFSTVI